MHSSLENYPITGLFGLIDSDMLYDRPASPHYAVHGTYLHKSLTGTNSGTGTHIIAKCMTYLFFLFTHMIIFRMHTQALACTVSLHDFTLSLFFFPTQILLNLDCRDQYQETDSKLTY